MKTPTFGAMLIADKICSYLGSPAEDRKSDVKYIAKLIDGKNSADELLAALKGMPKTLARRPYYEDDPDGYLEG